MLVFDCLVEPLAQRREPALWLLHHDQRERDQSTLTYEIRRVGQHGLKECDSIPLPGGSTGHANSHGSAIPGKEQREVGGQRD